MDQVLRAADLSHPYFTFLHRYTHVKAFAEYVNWCNYWCNGHIPDISNDTMLAASRTLPSYSYSFDVQTGLTSSSKDYTQSLVFNVILLRISSRSVTSIRMRVGINESKDSVLDRLAHGLRIPKKNSILQSMESMSAIVAL